MAVEAHCFHIATARFLIILAEGSGTSLIEVLSDGTYGTEAGPSLVMSVETNGSIIANQYDYSILVRWRTCEGIDAKLCCHRSP
jgi:hypothetical protein